MIDLGFWQDTVSVAARHVSLCVCAWDSHASHIQFDLAFGASRSDLRSILSSIAGEKNERLLHAKLQLHNSEQHLQNSKYTAGDVSK